MRKTVFIAVSILAMAGSAVSAAYQLTNADVAVVEGRIVTYAYSGGGAEPTDLIIPVALHGQTITIIGEEAFRNMGLTSVVFPSSLLIVENRAFSGNALSSLTLPDNLEEIQSSAFSANSLTGLILPGSVHTIGSRSFSFNSLSSIVLPDGLHTLGEGAFNNNAIVQINGQPSDGIVFGRNPDGSEDNTAIVSYGGSATTIDFIPGSVRIIGPSSFSGTGLTEVVIPEGVTTIQVGAFVDNAITTLTLPGTLVSMGNRAFNNNSITQVNGAPSQGLIYARNPDGSEDQSTIVSYGGTATTIDFIPEGVEVIDNRVFFVGNISSVTFPSTLKTIRSWAFYHNGISGIILPEGLDSIGDYAFYSNSLSSLTIPSTVTYIGERAFAHNGITPSLDIPGSVKYIGERAFYDNDIEHISLHYGLEHIGENAFEGNYSLDMRGVTLPNSLVYIGSMAFGYEDFTLPCPYRENYTVKWNEGQYSCGDEVNAHDTYIATFVPFTYTISYVLNGGANGWNPESYSREDEIVFNDPSKSGYPFEGWYANAEFTGAAITGIGPGAFGDTTLYAKWGSAISYSITYVLDGGTNGTNPADYTVEDAFVLAPPTKAGSTFMGWYREPEFWGNIVTSIETGTTGDLTLYARWDSYSDAYFFAGDHGVLVGETYQSVSNGGNSNAVGAIASSGYQFIKWIDSTGDSITGQNPLVVYNIQSDTSLTAIFEAFSCAGIFYDTVTTEVFDTTFVTVYDSISVTDTLVIDAVLTGIDPPGNMNTLKVYPNPAKDHLYINTGDYTRMTGYRLKIINQSGSLVYETNVEIPLYEIDLNSWTGPGLYFIQVIDASGQVNEIRKIILQ